MNSLNKVSLIGRLGKDPEVKATGTGKTVTSISLVTSEKWKTPEGEQKEKAEWHRLIIWGKLADIAGNYLRKGKQVFIEGKVTYREYMDKEQKKCYITEIIVSNLVFLGSKEDGAGHVNEQKQSEPNEETQKFGPGMNTGGGDIPF